MNEKKETEKKETFKEMTARVLSGMEAFQEEYKSGVEYLVWLQCNANGAFKQVCVTCGKHEAERIANELRERLDPGERDITIGTASIERIRFADVKNTERKEFPIKKLYTL